MNHIAAYYALVAGSLAITLALWWAFALLNDAVNDFINNEGIEDNE